jgi:protein TonB
MASAFQSGEIERGLAADPVAGPAAGSIVLHAVLFGAVLFSAIFSRFFHHSFWGAPGPGSAIQVSLTSSALPLPSDQPRNENVLPTETPSQAPAPPAPKAKEAVDQTAIPIPGKEQKPEKPKPTPPPPKVENKAQFGEQSGSKLTRSTMAQPAAPDQPVSVNNGDFGSKFPWYVEGIKRKVSQNWLRGQVDPRTPRGATVQIYFKVNREGAPSSFRINTASGSPTLDRSCLLATQRVDTFGDLPRDSNDQWLDVTYDCTY